MPLLSVLPPVVPWSQAGVPSAVLSPWGSTALVGSGVRSGTKVGPSHVGQRGEEGELLHPWGLAAPVPRRDPAGVRGSPLGARVSSCSDILKKIPTVWLHPGAYCI